MITIQKVKLQKLKVLNELKNLNWKQVQNRTKGIDFITAHSNEKISILNNNINRKKKCLNKIKNDITKCKLSVEKITNFLNEQVHILDNKNLHNCPICLSKINKNQISLTKCGHLYCHNCLKSSLSYDCRCPVCREKLHSDDIILIHYNDTNVYYILDNEDKQSTSQLNDHQDVQFIQSLIRRGIRRDDYAHLENNNQYEHIIRRRNDSRQNIERENINLRNILRTYNSHLIALERNILNRINLDPSYPYLYTQQILQDIHTDDYEPVVNVYPRRPRTRLDAVSQKDLIIRIQKNLIQSLKHHINSLRGYIDIQNQLIDN